MKKVIEDVQRILSVAIVNEEITIADISEMLANLLPLFPKEKYDNPAD